MTEEKKIKLDLGCGSNKREGCTGIDINPDCGADIVTSVLKLPFEDESVNEAHSSHLVEHFSPEEAETFFNEIHRVLKKDGISYHKVDKDWTKRRLMKKDPTHKYRYTDKEIEDLVKKFSESSVEDKMYLMNYIPRRKIFVHLKK